MNIQSVPEVNTQLHMSSRKFKKSYLKASFIKLLISVQLGDN
jgi:hypothetical protein